MADDTYAPAGRTSGKSAIGLLSLPIVLLPRLCKKAEFCICSRHSVYEITKCAECAELIGFQVCLPRTAPSLTELCANAVSEAAHAKAACCPLRPL